MTTRPRPHATIPEPRRRGGARAVAELLPEIGGVAFRKFGFVQSAVVSRWGEIVGERFARVSAPESIRFPPGKRADGTLTLTVSGAHGTMMQHIAPEIVERVNRFFGYPAIARLQFRHGEVRPRRAVPVRRDPPPIPADMGETIRDIADPELREVLAALAGAVAAPPPPAIPILGKVR